MHLCVTNHTKESMTGRTDRLTDQGVYVNKVIYLWSTFYFYIQHLRFPVNRQLASSMGAELKWINIGYTNC